MWIFGYGSLIWKVDFPYERKTPGYIKHFVRRFWQKSTDHRGSPEIPGMVVTLIPYNEWKEKFESLDPHSHQEHDLCWGMAYKIAESDSAAVKAHLDYREKDGYSVFNTHVYTFSKESIPTLLVEDALVYVATTGNPNFHGPCSMMALSETIANTLGPSGPNSECKFFY